MGITVVFANQKGGVGKTTTAANLGAYLALAGKKILLVDFDPQGNLTLSVQGDKTKPGIYEVLVGQMQAKEAIQPTAEPGLDLLSSNIHLSGAGIELIGLEKREFFLRQALEPVKALYDYLFIDSPPSLDLLTVNGLSAADRVFIPLQCEYFAMEGVALLIKSIRAVQKNYNPGLEIGGIILTMLDKRTNLTNQVVTNAVNYFGNKVFRSMVPRNVALGEAPSFGQTINRYNPESAGAKAYAALAQEVIARG